MKVFIFGIAGNMGKRYAAICKYLGYQVTGHDLGYGNPYDYLKADRVIIATPTDTHFDILTRLSNVESLPVLCEKPISLSLDKVTEVVSEFRRKNSILSMVSQYDYLVEEGAQGETYYNYFKTGNDGLAWDCINIIKHATGNILLKNESPVWTCVINDRVINIADMDMSYIEMLRIWVDRPTCNYDELINTHKKVITYLEESNGRSF